MRSADEAEISDTKRVTRGGFQLDPDVLVSAAKSFLAATRKAYRRPRTRQLTQVAARALHRRHLVGTHPWK